MKQKIFIRNDKLIFQPNYIEYFLFVEGGYYFKNGKWKVASMFDSFINKSEEENASYKRKC